MTHRYHDRKVGFTWARFGSTVRSMVTYRIGPESGTLMLRTGRQGLAASAGHDLTIEIADWSGTVTMGEQPTDAGVDVTMRLNSLRVLAGTGGVKPLSERDKREILGNAAKTLGTARFPEARFVSTAVTPGDRGGSIEGTLTLHGVDRPTRLELTSTGGQRYGATGTIVQSAHGIKPYTGLFGALKLADAVSLDIDVDLGKADQQADRQPSVGP